MATRTFDCIKEQNVSQLSGGSGSGNDRHAPIGLASGNIFRDLMKFGLSWTATGGDTKVYQITKAELWVKRTSEVHVAFGGTPRVLARRITASWNENGGGENSWSSLASTTYGGPATTATGESDSGALATGHEGWSHFDITPIVEAWAPAWVLKSGGGAGGAQDNQGLRLVSNNEGSATPTIEFYSRRATASDRPYVKLTYSDNAPPNAPVITSPVGSSTPEIIASSNGTADPTTFGFSDPDAGDTCAQFQIQYYDAFATDNGSGVITGGTLAIDVTGTPTPTGPTNAYLAPWLSLLTPRTAYRKRLRTQDNHGAWGAWTNLADGYVQLAYLPAAPLNPVMQTTPDSPHIFGTINSGDAGDYVTGWEGEFYLDNPDSSTTTLWAPGPQDIGGSSTRSDVIYGGVALNVGQKVRWRHRHRNRDQVVGAWSPFYTTVIASQAGPSTMTPSDTSTKLLTRTPTFTIGDAAAFTTYRWRIYRAGQTVYDSGTVTVGSTSSVTPAVPSGVLSWGDGAAGEMSWDAQVRGETFSPARPFRVDSLPTTTLTASA